MKEVDVSETALKERYNNFLIFVSFCFCSNYWENKYFVIPMTMLMFTSLVMIAEFMNSCETSKKTSLKTMNLSDSRPQRLLKRRRRLNVKFFDEVSDDEDEKVEVIRDSRLHLLRFDNSSTATSSLDLTGKVITAQVEKISMKPRLEKSFSVPNFSLETPLSGVIKDLQYLRSNLDNKRRSLEVLNNVLRVLKKPETLTLPQRVHKSFGDLDKTWCNYINPSHQPYSESKQLSNKSKSFRYIKKFKTDEIQPLKKIHSFDWLNEKKAGQRKRRNSDSEPNPRNFTFLPSRVVGKTLNQWNLDVFELSKETGSRPLTWLLNYIARERNWFEIFSIEEKVFNNFCAEVEAGYQNDNPYHNHCHAADVVNSTYYLFSKVNFAARFDELAFFVGIIAAAVHDLQHPGKTARFLIHNKDPLALTYNDTSILEQMHLAEAFKILNKPECNILAGFTNEEYLRFRKLMIKAVMSTDLMNHLDTIREVKQNESTLFSPVSEETHEELILCLGLKLADVGHAGKCRKLHEAWSEKIQEEFFLQGDAERELGLDISMHMDRSKPNLADNQLGFFKFVALPLFECVADTTYCPDKFLPLYQQLLDNENYWFQNK